MMVDNKTSPLLDQDEAMESYFDGLLSILETDEQPERKVSASNVKLLKFKSTVEEESNTRQEHSVEAQRVEIERVEAKRVEAKRVEAQRVEAERVEAERVEAERVEAERVEAERVEAKRVEAKRVEAERVEAERVEAERVEAERVEAERVEAERVEAERVEAKRVEAKRVEAERVEAKRVEAKRVEAERVEAERVEAQRVEAERVEAERVEVERVEVERVEAQRVQAEPQKVDLNAPLWARSKFNVLIGGVNNVNVAFPASAISGELEFGEDLKNVNGQPPWVLGLKMTSNDFIAVIDVGHLLLDQPLRDVELKPFKKIIMLANSRWGIALDSVSPETEIDTSGVKWRAKSKIRQWLCGIESKNQLVIVDPTKMFEKDK